MKVYLFLIALVSLIIAGGCVKNVNQSDNTVNATASGESNNVKKVRKERPTSQIRNNHGTQSHADESAKGTGKRNIIVKIKITDGPIKVRQEPSLKHKPICSLHRGDEIEIVDRGEKWTKIRCKGSHGNMINGWIITSALDHKDNKENSKANTVKSGTLKREEVPHEKLSPM